MAEVCQMPVWPERLRLLSTCRGGSPSKAFGWEDAQVNRLKFVADHQRRFGLKRLCQLLGIARSSKRVCGPPPHVPTATRLQRPTPPLPLGQRGPIAHKTNSDTKSTGLTRGT